MDAVSARGQRGRRGVERIQDGPEVEELDDVDVGELLALDAHVDRVQRARGLVLLVEAEVVQLALERRVVLVPEVERALALELRRN